MLPELEKMKKQNPFVVPENYFNEFSEHLTQRINAEEEHKSVFRKVYVFLKPAIGLAASLILIFLLVYSPLKKTPKISNSIHPNENITQSQTVFNTKNEPALSREKTNVPTEYNSENKLQTNTTNTISPSADEIGTLVSDYDIVYAEQ